MKLLGMIIAIVGIIFDLDISPKCPIGGNWFKKLHWYAKVPIVILAIILVLSGLIIFAVSSK